MAVNNYFGHQSAVTGQWPNQMARNAGYVLPANCPNDNNFIESLAAGTFYDTAAEPLNALIVDQGIPSLGHRNHLLGIDSFNADNREIGVGHAFNGSAQYDHYWAIHATRTSASDRFVTGVAFNDTNGNSRYDLNEGLANVVVTVGAFTTATNAAGGWSVKVPQGSYLVTAAGGGFVGTSTALVGVSGDNVEVDFLSGNPQPQVNFTVPPPPLVSLSISDTTVTEGSGGTTNMVFNVTLSGTTPQTVVVSYSTAGGSAAAGSDFQSASGVLTFTPGVLSRQITVQAYADLLVEGTENFTVNLSNASGATLADGQGQGTILNDDTSYARPNEILAVAPGPGRETAVRVLDRANGAERFRFTAFPGFSGGVQIATGDVNADGVLDIVAAAGPGGGPHVQVFDGTTGNQIPGTIGSFYAYAPSFTGGVMVAAADITGDGRAEIITAPAGNGGPHVRIFNGATGGIVGDYFAYGATFNGGVRVGAGDIDGNGTPDVITAAGPGGGPHLRVFSGATATPISGPLSNFFAYSANFTGGVYVAAGDVNGDGRADIVTGPGAGGGPHVRVFSGQTGAELFGFFAYAANFTGGVRVATARRQWRRPRRHRHRSRHRRWPSCAGLRRCHPRRNPQPVRLRVELHRRPVCRRQPWRRHVQRQPRADGPAGQRGARRRRPSRRRLQ